MSVLSATYLKHFSKFQPVRLNFRQPTKCLATTETLVPVNLSYATYESTTSQNNTSPLIVAHGLFGSKSNWKSLCKAIQHRSNPHRKIIAIDARNHGESPHDDHHTYAHMAADIKTLYDQLGIKKAALMGHSMGGRSVMLFTLKYPELVERLLVVDISPVTISSDISRSPDIFKALERIRIPVNVTMSQARTSVENQLLEDIPDQTLRAFLMTNLVQKSNGSYGWRINIPSLLTNFNNLSKFPIVNDMQYKGPVLFIGGSNSDYIPQSDYPKIRELFPNAELKYIEGAGHWLHSEKPEEFLKLAVDFLNKKVENT